MKSEAAHTCVYW